MLTLPKDPGEVLTLAIGFRKRLGARTIISATSDIACITGTDPSPASVLLGTPSIPDPPLAVVQKVHGGVAGCSYLGRLYATLDDGDTLVGPFRLDIRLGG
jgi:hypothetical protein